MALDAEYKIYVTDLSMCNDTYNHTVRTTIRYSYVLITLQCYNYYNFQQEHYSAYTILLNDKHITFIQKPKGQQDNPNEQKKNI